MKLEKLELAYCIKDNRVFCKSSKQCIHELKRITHEQYIEWILNGKKVITC
jgi:hypothetical protein